MDEEGGWMRRRRGDGGHARRGAIDGRQTTTGSRGARPANCRAERDIQIVARSATYELSRGARTALIIFFAFQLQEVRGAVDLLAFFRRLGLGPGQAKSTAG